MKKKIFALEGEWERNPKDKTSSIDVLAFLHNVLELDYFHRRVATKEELKYHLSSKSKYKGYDFIYLAFHGEKGKIWPNDDQPAIELDFLENFKPLFKDKVLHISSCSTLDIQESEIKALKKKLQLKAISGYTEDVDWVASMIFEIDYFQLWSNNDLIGKNGKLSVVKLRNSLFKKHPFLAKELGFVVY